jgi:hypothetical protein
LLQRAKFGVEMLGCEESPSGNEESGTNLVEIETYARVGERRGSCLQVAIQSTRRGRESRNQRRETLEDRRACVAAVRGGRCRGK